MSKRVRIVTQTKIPSDRICATWYMEKLMYSFLILFILQVSYAPTNLQLYIAYNSNRVNLTLQTLKTTYINTQVLTRINVQL